MAQAQQQMQRLQALNTELMQKLAFKEIALKGKDEKRDIDATNAETNRTKVMIEALARLHLTPQQKAQMEHELAMASHSTGLELLKQANAGTIDSQSAADQQGHDLGMAAMDQAHQQGMAASQQAHQANMAAMAPKPQGST